MIYLIRIIILLAVCDLCALALRLSLDVPAKVLGASFYFFIFLEIFVTLTKLFIQILELPGKIGEAKSGRTSAVS